MDKRILEIINDYPQWKGDVYRLAVLIVAEQKVIDMEEFGPKEAEE